LRRLTLLMALVGVLLMVMPTFAQDGSGYRWPIPVNSGESPANTPLVPPAEVMPVLPLPEPLMPGTLFFNAEAFGDQYRILNLTFDERLYAYNISTGRGVLPVSPNGKYGIITLSDSFEGPVTCGIVDLLTKVQVDEFHTDGACSGVAWSPDSTRLLFTLRDENGVQSIGVRQNGETQFFRPMPVPEADIAGSDVNGTDVVYLINGWLSNNTYSFDFGLQGALSESLFVTINDPNTAYPAISLSEALSDNPLVLFRPAQPLGTITRGLWLTNLVTGDTFSLAPGGHTAILGDVSPDGKLVAYWAATVNEFGPVHPLRLVIYDTETDVQEVLIQFDGPSDHLATRPGLIVWNDEGIYFHLSNQPEAANKLQTGTYRISRDGFTLEFISTELLMDSLPE
jgi:hypothetical protein